MPVCPLTSMQSGDIGVPEYALTGQSVATKGPERSTAISTGSLVPDSQTVRQSDRQTVRQSDSQTVRQSVRQSDSQIVR